MKTHQSGLIFVLVVCFLALPARAEEIAVGAAADLNFAMNEVAGQYERQTGNKVNVTYGSSGNFSSQLQNGAPFDLFFRRTSSIRGSWKRRALLSRERSIRMQLVESLSGPQRIPRQT